MGARDCTVPKGRCVGKLQEYSKRLLCVIGFKKGGGEGGGGV